MYRIIKKSMVKAWLRKLIKRGTLVAPTRLTAGDVVFKELFTPDDILLEFKQPLYSVKPFFIPQEETMFTFQNGSVETLEEVFDDFPRIFFGLRPCDLRAITQADTFFSGDFADPYYLQRRKRTLLIVIGCNHPEPQCFCHTMGIGPFYQAGADIFMIDLGSDFAVTANTPKGEETIKAYQYFFAEASEQQLEDVFYEELLAKNQLRWNMPKDAAIPEFAELSDGFWEQVSRRCFSCGGCSYICPLCFCYNVVDRQNKDLQGKRIRTWDSCIFEGFTRMAGRHNLFRSREARLKKRFAHKLEQYPQKYGFPGCTGCGRCTVICPGKIGMQDVLKKMAAEVSIDEKK